MPAEGASSELPLCPAVVTEQGSVAQAVSCRLSATDFVSQKEEQACGHSGAGRGTGPGLSAGVDTLWASSTPSSHPSGQGAGPHNCRSPGSCKPPLSLCDAESKARALPAEAKPPVAGSRHVPAVVKKRWVGTQKPGVTVLQNELRASLSHAEGRRRPRASRRDHLVPQNKQRVRSSGWAWASLTLGAPGEGPAQARDVGPTALVPGKPQPGKALPPAHSAGPGAQVDLSCRAGVGPHISAASKWRPGPHLCPTEHLPGTSEGLALEAPQPVCPRQVCTLARVCTAL